MPDTPPSPPRVICHLDMDAFFAAVEQHDRPELRGLPVLIGSDRPRGVVATASYEARRYGCGSAQPMAVAKRRCPQAIIVPPRMRRYVEVSEQVFAILHDVSPLVEPLSIDEAFVDLTGTRRLLGDPVGVARGLKRKIVETTGLTASVGLAPNKYVAKLASEMDKPDGLTVVTPERVREILDPLPVERMWGVGPAMARLLHGIGLSTMRDVRCVDPVRLKKQVGNSAEHLQALARGEDDRTVTPDHGAKSVGQERTFEEDLERPADVLRVLHSQADQVGRRLRANGLRAAGVTVKIRFGDFETITRATTLPRPTDASGALRDAAAVLFREWSRRGFQPVRLIGVSAGRLTATREQLSLFPDPKEVRGRKLDAALDRIQDKFGAAAIRRGE